MKLSSKIGSLIKYIFASLATSPTEKAENSDC